MLPFTDLTAAVDEPKSARMEQRTKPHVKLEIQQAAALLGVDETAFITSAAYDRARDVIVDHSKTILQARDREVLLTALDNPPAPTSVMKKAFDLHETHVVHEE